MKTITSKMPIKYENMDILSPQFVSAINLEITEALRDVNSRPQLEKGREVNIQLVFTPILNVESDDPEDFEVEVKFSVSPVKRPKRVPNPARISLNKQNQGYFHSDFPTEPNRRGMFDDQKVEKK